MEVQQLPLNDLHVISDLIIKLQDYERSLDLSKKNGREIVELYLNELKKDLEEKKGTVFVSSNDELLIGFLSCFIAVEESDQVQPVLYVSDLFVDEEYRGKGVASLLMAEAEKYAAANGLSVLQLSALANNEQAQAFYSKCGFQEYQKILRKNLKTM
jgi:ribosomal protein S18 acetylase RimI-like enzyme